MRLSLVHKRIQFNLYLFFSFLETQTVCEAATGWMYFFSSAKLNQSCLVPPWKEQKEVNQEEVCSMPEHCCISEGVSKWVERWRKCWGRNTSWYSLFFVFFNGVCCQILEPIPYGEWRQDYSYHNLLFYSNMCVWSHREDEQRNPASCMYLVSHFYCCSCAAAQILYFITFIIFKSSQKHVWLTADPPMPDKWHNLYSSLSENMLLLA